MIEAALLHVSLLKVLYVDLQALIRLDYNEGNAFLFGCVGGFCIMSASVNL